MAEIVLGIGSSHSPQISSPIELWHDHAERDRHKNLLLGPDGEFHHYDELAEAAGASRLAELEPEVWKAKRARADAAIDILAAGAGPEVVVVVGDDQHELFGNEVIPAIALCLADGLVDLPPTAEQIERIPLGIRAALWARHGDAPEYYRVAADLSKHLASGLSNRFDVAQIRDQTAGRSLGHAFTFVRRRLGLAPDVPIVPVFLNTCFEPTVPSPRRCYELGTALGELIRDWEGCDRVAVVASGGLSHYVVLEEFDKSVLAAMRERDPQRLCAIPSRFFRSGTSETLNWVTAFGAVGDLQMRVVDYIPGYRSPAGTGTGIAFALWEPP